MRRKIQEIQVRTCLALLASMLLLGVAMTGWAGETTLEKINRTGVFTVGT